MYLKITIQNIMPITFKKIYQFNSKIINKYVQNWANYRAQKGHQGL